MSLLNFSIFSTLLILGSRILVNSQNCAIPSFIEFPPDDTRLETAEVDTILGSVQTFNVETITLCDDFIQYELHPNKTEEENSHIGFTNQSIVLKLKRPLKNELDDKKTLAIKSSAILTCQDGNEKTISFSIGIKDQNTKCPQFVYSEGSDYYYKVDVDQFESGDRSPFTSKPIVIKDGDRDAVNAEVTVFSDDQFGKNFGFVVPEFQITSESPYAEEHTFKFILTPQGNITSETRGIYKFQIKVKNNKAMEDPHLDCQSIANVTIHFSTPDTVDPPPNPFPHSTGPPEFQNFYYYAVITNISEYTQGTTLKGVIQPSHITAMDKEHDGNHTVQYSFVQAKTGGILNIDPNDGTVSFARDLTPQYISEIENNDNVEVYRVQAYIAETWGHPTMEFAYVPLMIVYDVPIYGNDTDCPGVTASPTASPTSPTRTTTIYTSTTTISPNFTTTQSPSTVGPTPSPTVLPTSLPTEHPTSLPTGSPTISPTIITSPTAPSQGTTTSEASEEASEEENSTSTTPEPEPECPICGVIETTYTCTAEGVFQDPYFCNVFHECVLMRELKQFVHHEQRCPPMTGFNNNTKQCEYPARCQCLKMGKIVYNRNTKEFVNVNRRELRKLQRRGYDPSKCTNSVGTLDDCSCGFCSRVSEGESVCDGAPADGLVADPYNCKVFHSCRRDSYNYGGYIDCVMSCGGDLVFNPESRTCDHQQNVPCLHTNWNSTSKLYQ